MLGVAVRGPHRLQLVGKGLQRLPRREVLHLTPLFMAHFEAAAPEAVMRQAEAGLTPVGWKPSPTAVESRQAPPLTLQKSTGPFIEF